MRLCFIWVKSYKGFSDFSLNLSGDFYFQFDYLSNTLTKNDNDNFIPNLFDPNISCVTAIVGKNGAGKSNCLELICTILQGSIHQFDTEFISVMEHNNKFYISHTLPSDLKASFSYLINQEKGKAKGFNTIFFSNVHDERFYEFSNNVITATANNGYGYRYFNNIGWRKRLGLFSIQIDLINKHRRSLQDEIKIQIPKYIMVEFAPVRAQRRHIKNSEEFSRAFKKRLGDMSNPESKFICMLKYSFLIRMIDIYVNLHFEQASLSLDFMEKEPTDAFLNRSINAMLQKLRDPISEKEIENSLSLDLNEQLKSDYSDLQQISECISSISPLLINNHVGSNSLCFKIEFSHDDHEVVKKLCHAFGSERTIRMSWIGISSGAKAYLTLLAVLNDKLKGTRNDTLICIDEGDLYLHPAWQIDFLHNLNKMLPKFFNAKLQLVLTSHSPFLLTDLPRDNVIILEGKKVVDKSQASLRTFGSNLYELYNNAFFLEGKRFGSFAEEHIKRVTNEIADNELQGAELDSAKKFIDMIGDKLLRNVLKGLLKND
ncbi:TPA: AAA family ATPase [Klebsiella variicola subsp. variicola]|nr:ATP-binding protein [Klebsiella michiganensis]HDK6357774.1 ATP-binding protein [Klebsiella variicola]